MKQTAVEWLYERLERMIPRSALYDSDKKQHFEQALEMERQQIVEAFDTACEDPDRIGSEYYTETYKSE